MIYLARARRYDSLHYRERCGAMIIDNIKNVDELNKVWDFVTTIFPVLMTGEYKYSRDFWAEMASRLPELLIYAKEGEQVCGAVLAWDDGGSITVGICCVAAGQRGKGIGKAMMLELEKRVRSLGYGGIALGAVEDAEGFYYKLGYSGCLLVQSETHSIEELLSLNPGYEVIATNVYDGTINQIYLNVTTPDHDIQRRYEERYPGCSTQMVFGKRFK